MKKQLFNKIKTKTSTVFLIPFLVLLAVFMVFYTPFDFIKFKKSRYHKDTKEKYSFLSGNSIYIKIYDLIRNNNLPIEYFRYNFVDISAYGFFKYNNLLVFCDCEVFFDNDKKQWFCSYADDEAILLSDEISGRLTDFNACFGYDVKKAVVLVNEEVYNDIKNCDFNNVDFIAVNNNDYISALKTIITTY